MTDAKNHRVPEARPTLVGLDAPTAPPPRLAHLHPVKTLDDDVSDRERIDALMQETRDFRTWQRDVFAPFRTQVLDDQATIKGGVLELVADMHETKRIAREAKAASEKEARSSNAEAFLEGLGMKTAEAGAQLLAGRTETTKKREGAEVDVVIHERRTISGLRLKLAAGAVTLVLVILTALGIAFRERLTGSHPERPSHGLERSP